MLQHELNIDFCIAGNSAEFTGEGWSHPERHGSWTLGRRSRLAVAELDRTLPHKISIQLIPFTHPVKAPFQALVIRVDGVECYNAEIRSGHTINLMVAPAAAGPARQGLELEFSCATALAPSDAGPSRDQRQLGVFVKAIDIYSERPADFLDARPQPNAKPVPAKPEPAKPAPTPVKTTDTASEKPAPAKPEPAPAAPIAQPVIGKKFPNDTADRLKPLLARGLSLEVGKYSYGHPNIQFADFDPRAKLTIGSFCSFAIGVTIFAGYHGRHSYDFITTSPLSYVFGNPGQAETSKTLVGDLSVRIGSDVWVGYNAVIMAGVNIGHGAVLGAGCVVTKDVPPYAIVAGVPARIIKYRFSEIQIRRLLAIAWWEWSDDKIARHLDHFYKSDIEQALKIFEQT